jgi:hypothetical protein
VIYAGGLIVLGALGLVVGQETASPLVPIVNAGVLGSLAVCFILGLIVPKSALDREMKRADRQEATKETMQDDYKAIVPVLERAMQAITAADQARTAQANQQAEIGVLLGQVRTALERGRRS